jgi:tyrosyl-tRNA synthetase
VTRYHGAGVAKAELDAFRHTFSERSEPDEMPEVVVTGEIATAFDLLRAVRPNDSNSALRRLLQQGAVTINGVRTDDPAAAVELGAGVVLKSGARTWHRITRQ